MFGPTCTNKQRNAQLRRNLRRVNERIHAATVGNQATATVKLVAVSKTRPASEIKALYDAGQRRFGENYIQEAKFKIDSLKECAIEWHFIGRIQSNKTREIAQTFDWIHSIERLSIARRLAAQRPGALPLLNVCIQINLSRETSKAGIDPPEVQGLALAIAELPGLRLRGLMTIPAPGDHGKEADRHAIFARLGEICHELNHQGLHLDTLSMGMSHDLEEAIGHGATIVRVGSAIFGPRAAK